MAFWTSVSRLTFTIPGGLCCFLIRRSDPHAASGLPYQHRRPRRSQSPCPVVPPAVCPSVNRGKCFIKPSHIGLGQSLLQNCSFAPP